MENYCNSQQLADNEYSAWNRVLKARMITRPQSRDYINKLCDDFLEVGGDRCMSDDKSIITGIGSIMGTVVTIIGQQKGYTLQEKKECNFGMPKPSGYRKSMRAIKQAQKFKRPIICFIDTPGASCDIEAEQLGQGTVIAEHLQLIASAEVPVISVLIGEGGSGGALALSISDKLLALENSYFSVISPEGCASILFKDSKLAYKAAHNLHLSPNDLFQLGIVDEIFNEKEIYTKETITDTVNSIKASIINNLSILQNYSIDELISRRYERFLNFKVSI